MDSEESFCIEEIEFKGGYQGAKEACERAEMTLPSISSKEEFDFLVQTAFDGRSTSQSIYLGVKIVPGLLSYAGGKIVLNDNAKLWRWNDDYTVDASLINDIFVESTAMSSSTGKCLAAYVSGPKKGSIFRTGCTKKADKTVCKARTPEPEYCYEIRWANTIEDAAKNEWAGRRVLSPVTKLPSEHPKMKGGNCGTSSDGKIFRYDLWSVVGAKNANGATCKVEEGGDVFYAFLDTSYSGPLDHSSSNNGYAIAEAAQFYFVVDAEKQGYLVTTVDKAGNDDFGNTSQRFSMALSGKGVSGSDSRIIREDGPSDLVPPPGKTCLDAPELTSKKQDCYAWDPALGYGTFFWTWRACCTDGMVIGPLPSNDFCLDLTVKEFRGLNKITIGDYVDELRTIVNVDIPLSVDAPIQICGYTCPEFCATKKSCGACTAHPQCGWCGSTGMCEPKAVKGACLSDWTDFGTCCSECTSIADSRCDECVSKEGCAFDSSTGSCISGDASVGETCTKSSVSDACFNNDDACASSTRTIWFNNCATRAPSQSPTEPMQTKAPTNPTPSPTLAPVKRPSPPECRVDVQCGDIDALKSLYQDAQCSVASQFAGYPKDDVDACFCDFKNCTSEASAFPVAATAGGGAGFLLIAALALYLVSRRRRSQLLLSQGQDIEMRDTAWNKNPMGKKDAKPILADLGSIVGAGQNVMISTNNPRLAQILTQYASRNNTFKCVEGGETPTRPPKPRRWINKLLNPEKKSDSWDPHTDPSTKRIYYYNPKTGQTMWTKPGSISEENETPPKEPIMRQYNFLPNRTSDLPELLKFLNKYVWSKHYDPATRRNYYVNKATREAVWLTPVR